MIGLQRLNIRNLMGETGLSALEPIGHMRLMSVL